MESRRTGSHPDMSFHVQDTQLNCRFLHSERSECSVNYSLIVRCVAACCAVLMFGAELGEVDRPLSTVSREGGLFGEFVSGGNF